MASCSTKSRFSLGWVLMGIAAALQVAATTGALGVSAVWSSPLLRWASLSGVVVASLALMWAWSGVSAISRPDRDWPASRWLGVATRCACLLYLGSYLLVFFRQAAFWALAGVGLALCGLLLSFYFSTTANKEPS